MAKITIHIEDLPGDKVKVTSDPSMETMIKMDISGNKLTSAHGYAFNLLNNFRHLGKMNDPNLKLIIPKVSRF